MNQPIGTEVSGNSSELLVQSLMLTVKFVIVNSFA